MNNKTYDFAVVGAGVFGAWTAHFLRQSGASVALLDAYGPANSRASSGGETRVIRMGYGPDELYTRWAMQSLPLWREFAARTGQEIFRQTGVLWLSNEADVYLKSLCIVLAQAGVKREELEAGEIARRWPQLRFHDVTWGVLEPDSGLLLARNAVQILAKELAANGVDCIPFAANAPAGNGRLAHIKKTDGSSISAATFVFCCGPWLPKLFPEFLGDRIFPTRQEVFFLGTPGGSTDFRPPKMPVWLHRTHAALPYALPDIEGRGFKIAFDRHGDRFDPDNDMRVVGESSITQLREYLRQYIPQLEHAPVLETRVCQYENTWNGDFLIDRHPQFENVWIAGGGSGHGFKHGPALGEYLSARILHGTPGEPRFSLAVKQTAPNRAVY
ncbi:MAG TPA: FAD-dependent oxidoreductase [Candidatus Angelobacter sp.]|nr:FAD-dependent oxidoreductase [Candidatus Angelobacter sp.]